MSPSTHKRTYPDIRTLDKKTLLRYTMLNPDTWDHIIENHSIQNESHMLNRIITGDASASSVFNNISGKPESKDADIDRMANMVYKIIHENYNRINTWINNDYSKPRLVITHAFEHKIGISIVHKFPDNPYNQALSIIKPDHVRMILDKDNTSPTGFVITSMYPVHTPAPYQPDDPSMRNMSLIKTMHKTASYKNAQKHNNIAREMFLNIIADGCPYDAWFDENDPNLHIKFGHHKTASYKNAQKHNNIAREMFLNIIADGCPYDAWFDENDPNLHIKFGHDDTTDENDPNLHIKFGHDDTTITMTTSPKGRIRYDDYYNHQIDEATAIDTMMTKSRSTNNANISKYWRAVAQSIHVITPYML